MSKNSDKYIVYKNYEDLILGFKTPANLGRRNGDVKMKSYLNQSNKFSTIGHRINSQISEEFGCTDAEYFSLFKMTEVYLDDPVYWDKYINDLLFFNYSNNPDGIECPVHLINWHETEVYDYFYPYDSPNLNEMRNQFEEDGEFQKKINELIKIINKGRIKGLKNWSSN